MLMEVSNTVVDEFIDDEHILLFGGRIWDAEPNTCFACDMAEAIALSIYTFQGRCFVDPVYQLGVQ